MPREMMNIHLQNCETRFPISPHTKNANSKYIKDLTEITTRKHRRKVSIQKEFISRVYWANLMSEWTFIKRRHGSA